MDQPLPALGLQLRSRVKPTEEIGRSPFIVEILPPAAEEVVVRIEATPINPSDSSAFWSAQLTSVPRG